MQSTDTASGASAQRVSLTVFLAHGSVDSIWLINLGDVLRNAGMRILRDRPTLSPEERTRALEQSQAGLLIWSSAERDAGRMLQAFEGMATRVRTGAFPIVIARTDGAAVPEFTRGATIVDFPQYKNGPTGGEAERLRLALAGVPLSQDAKTYAQEDAEAGAFIARMADGKDSVERLQKLRETGGPWETSSALGSALANRLTELGKYDVALDVVRTVGQRFPAALRPRQMEAHALARRGKATDLAEAQRILKTLYDDNERDPETLGLYARTFMDEYNAIGNASALRRSRDLYKEAYDLDPESYYTGINAAAKSLFLRTDEDRELGKRIAQSVQSRIGRTASSKDYWENATVAEAHLILGDYDEAATVYKQAIDMARGDTGSHATTWKQASKLMAVLQVPEAQREKIHAAFGNPPPAPPLAVSQEFRFAIVMYGGVSLAIYINGVTQEFFHLVRATAANPKDRNQPLVPDDELEGTERIYRRAAQLLGRERDDIKRAVTPDDPIRARFVVDILSGTSAGGINAIFLAKALANKQSIAQLTQLWVDEGAIERLINDGESVENLNGLRQEVPPTSLLNGRRMYRKLLDAFDGMDKAGGNKTGERSPYVEELDLFVTTTDIRGLPVSLRLADGMVTELRHRNVFNFRYSDGFSSDAANDFERDINPFLAYAARCTSSFPFAFPPMKLTDIDEVLEHTPGRQGDTSLGKNVDRWRRFFPAYAQPSDGSGAAPGVYDFTDRAFGDGGYLDNKPFSHAIDALRSRRGGVRSHRKLVFIEPSPERPDLASRPGDRPNVIENVNAALSLARYETIRDDLDRIRTRNRLIERVGRIIGGVEDDVRVAQEAAPTIRPNFGDLNLADMVRRFGVAYGGYHRLKVSNLTDDLAGLLSRLSQFDDRSDEYLALRYLVRAWRDERFTADEEDDSRATENRFLASYDLPYRLRRLEFVLAKVDQLSGIDDTTRDLFSQRKAGDVPQSEGDRVAFRAELARLSGELAAIYEPLRRGHLTLQRRDETNPAASLIGSLALGQSSLHDLLEKPTDHERLAFAKELLATRTGALDELAKALAEYIYALTSTASEKCAALFAIPETVGQPASQGGAEPSTNPFATLATGLVRHYYESYDRYDLVLYPILQSASVGEEIDTVDVIRISPEDARSLIDERNTSRRKLAGTKLMHFGAFLDHGWRENDILWGRMDGVERILSTILPPNEPEMASLLEDAQLEILRHAYVTADRDRLCKLLADGLVARRSTDKTELALRAAVEGEPGRPISPALQAALRANLEPKVLLQFFRDKYEVHQALDPKAAARSLARSTRVISAMIEQLSKDSGVGTTPATWVALLARGVWGLVEVAVPDTLANLVVRHWLKLLYLFEGLLILGGTVFAEPSIQRLGVTTLVVTGSAHLALITLGRVMHRRRPWSALGLAVAAGAILGLLGLGAFTLTNANMRATLWRQIKSGLEQRLW